MHVGKCYIFWTYPVAPVVHAELLRLATTFSRPLFASVWSFIVMDTLGLILTAYILIDERDTLCTSGT